MQKKLIASLIATGFAGAAGVAVAGPISVASIGTYAAETIGAAAGPIALGNVAYTLSSPFAINSTQSIKYTLSSKVDTCPTVALAAPGVAGVVISAPGAPTGAGSNICSYTVTVAGNAVPANQLVNLTAAKADKTAGAVLAGGAPLNATVAVFDGSNNQVESNSATVAVAAQALGANFTASAPGVAGGLFPTATNKFENAKIDVTVTPVSTAFTTSQLTGGTTTIALGAFSVTESAGGPFLDSDGVANVNIASLTTNKWSLTVTGPFVTNANAGVVFLASDNACAAPIAGGNFTLSGNTATLAGFNALPLIPAVVNGVNTVSGFVCYTPQAGLAPAKLVQILAGQFSGSATTSSATAVTPTNMQGESASGNLYNLASNGAQIDLRLVTTSGTAGWNSVVRITNTGGVAAPVTATYINTDGTTGASGVILANLAAGATAMLSASQIETALGISLGSTGNPPRLRLSAPTNSMRAQVWVQQPGGNWFMGTPAQDADAAGNPVNSGQFQ